MRIAKCELRNGRFGTMGRLVIVTCCCLSVAASAWAFSFGVDPSHLNFKTKPGDSTVQQLNVINYGKDAVQLSLSVEEWTLQSDNAKAFGLPGFSPYGCGAWITVEPQTLSLAPGQTGTVTVVMATPTDSVGGHQAVVFAQNLPDLAKQKDGAAALVGKVGAIVYQDTDGSSAAKFTAQQQGIEAEMRTQTMHLEVKNTGNTFVSCGGYAMILKEDTGVVVDRQNLSGWPLLPGDVKTPTVTFNKQPLGPGKYLFLVSVESEGLDPVVIEEGFTF